jgi:regulator of replication initiation timing
MNQISLDNVEKLQIHIEGLQATLTKRNKRIAELEAKLAVPIDLGPEVKKKLEQAYKDGWKKCATMFASSVRDMENLARTVYHEQDKF